MSALFDSAILVKLFVFEANSPDAIALVRSYPLPILFTDLQETEARNALRLKCRRNELDSSQLHLSLQVIESDLAAGRLQRTALDWPQVWSKARDLSALYALETNCRTLDTLHVACALILGVADFGSFDPKQRVMAAKAGLNVKP